MLFAGLVLFSAFLIEGIGTLISTIGLASLFASNPIIIVLAIALDLGKVCAVSFLYKHFASINLLMKIYMLAAVAVLMLITSAGAFGYLSHSFQTAIQNTSQNAIVINSLIEEQARLQRRKEEIDLQIANLPTNSVAGRRRLMASFAPEVSGVTSRLAEISQQLPKLKVESVKADTEVGPIIYIAAAFGTDPAHAVKWVILTIIFVFDPLAVSLLLAANYLFELHRRQSMPIAPVSSAVDTEVSSLEVIDDRISTANQPPPPQETIQRYGYQRYNEKPVEEFDHLTRADLGSTKPVEINIDPTEPNPSPPVSPVTDQINREIISLDQLLPKTRSQLEDLDANNGLIDNDESTWLKPLKNAGQIGTPIKVR